MKQKTRRKLKDMLYYFSRLNQDCSIDLTIKGPSGHWRTYHDIKINFIVKSMIKDLNEDIIISEEPHLVWYKAIALYMKENNPEYYKKIVKRYNKK